MGAGALSCAGAGVAGWEDAGMDGSGGGLVSDDRIGASELLFSRKRTTFKQSTQRPFYMAGGGRSPLRQHLGSRPIAERVGVKIFHLFPSRSIARGNADVYTVAGVKR